MQVLKATRKQIYEARTLEQLRYLEKKCGYVYGWAEKIHQARVRKKCGSWKRK